MKPQQNSNKTILLTGLLLFANIVWVFAQADDTVMSKSVSKSEMASLEWMPCPPPLETQGCYITVLQGDPSQPNSDILFKLEPGGSVPRHWHSSAERMIMISGNMEVTYDGEETQVLRPGTYAYGPSDKPHDAKCLDGEEPCILFIAFVKPVDSYVKTD